MSIALLNEIVEKAAGLTNAERRELIQLLQEQEIKKQSEERERKLKPSGNNNFIIHPNTAWLKENSHKYRGLYVALKDGELIATGRTIKEADLAAKEKGFSKTLLHRIPGENEEVWGGW